MAKATVNSMRITSLQELENIRRQYEEKQKKYKYRVAVCSGTGCISSNCGEVKDALLEALKKKGLTEEVFVSCTGCIGLCSLGPLVAVYPEGVLYTKLTPAKVAEIVEAHLVNSEIKTEYTYYDVKKNIHIPRIGEIDFFKEQVRISLRNCGYIDCSSLEEYLAKDGYLGLARALLEMQPAEVVKAVKDSGLRGRGGAGFPTGVKWESTLNTPGKEKYFICNADEGIPGSYMDKALLEGDPHTIIEGMLIGAYAVGATKGYAYIRAEYPLAVDRLDAAINQARKAGLLGQNILGSRFDFDIEIRTGAGAFICGEETAMMQSIEGLRGEPRQKPPLPTESGLFGKPTVINNVETLASIPPILFNGPAWYSSFGTEDSKGTKVFSLSGSMVNNGLIEVPMGVTLRKILEDIGGGIKNNKAFKAAQTGGPSGGCITSEYLDTPLDFSSMQKIGTIMGSGDFVVMDEDTCMLDMVKYFMEFVQEESCGRCTSCRIGTKRMLEIIERITSGAGREGDIGLLEELGQTIQETSACGLGQTAPNSVLSTIRYFREEYNEHIRNKYCRGGVCTELSSFARAGKTEGQSCKVLPLTTKK